MDRGSARRRRAVTTDVRSGDPARRAGCRFRARRTPSRGYLESSLEDYDTAFAYLDPANPRTGTVTPQRPVVHVPELVEVLVGLGRLDEARSRLEPYEERAVDAGSDVRHRPRRPLPRSDPGCGRRPRRRRGGRRRGGRAQRRARLGRAPRAVAAGARFGATPPRAQGRGESHAGASRRRARRGRCGDLVRAGATRAGPDRRSLDAVRRAVVGDRGTHRRARRVGTARTPRSASTPCTSAARPSSGTCRRSTASSASGRGPSSPPGASPGSSPGDRLRLRPYVRLHDPSDETTAGSGGRRHPRGDRGGRRTRSRDGGSNDGGRPRGTVWVGNRGLPGGGRVRRLDDGAR